METISVQSLRDIDKLIARVMGWNWFRNIRQPNWYSLLNHSTSSIDWELIEGVEDDSLLVRSGWDWKVPQFSTQLNDVWSLVEQLISIGYEFGLITWMNNNWHATFVRKGDLETSEAGEWIGIAETPALAICKAILAMHQISILQV